MAGAYASGDSVPKYSQGELDAAVGARCAEVAAAAERAAADAARRHKARVANLEVSLAAARAEADSAQAAAAACGDQDAVISDLVARLEDFESSHNAKLAAAEKGLAEKTIHLDLITRQYLDLRAQASKAAEGHSAELAAAEERTAAARAQLRASEDTLSALQHEFEGLREVEREKRAAAVLKMKEDMKALAVEQFAEANKQYRAVSLRARQAMDELTSARVEAARAAEETSRISEELAAARAAAAAAGAQATAREGAALAREEAAAAEARALRGKVSTLEQSVEDAQRARDDAVADRMAMQDSLARSAFRENALLKENAELKEVSEQLLALLEQHQIQL